MNACTTTGKVEYGIWGYTGHGSAPYSGAPRTVQRYEPGETLRQGIRAYLCRKILYGDIEHSELRHINNQQTVGGNGNNSM